MSYGAIADMAKSSSLLTRIAAAAAQEGISNPWQWANDHLWEIAASPDWDAKWDSAKAAWADLNATWQITEIPDYGARTDVISDSYILAAVQALNVG